MTRSIATLAFLFFVAVDGFFIFRGGLSRIQGPNNFEKVHRLNAAGQKNIGDAAGETTPGWSAADVAKSRFKAAESKKSIVGESSSTKDPSVDNTGPPHRAQEVVAAASTVPPLAEVYAVDKSFSSTSNVELDHLKFKIKAVEFRIDNFPSTSLPEGADEVFVSYVKRYECFESKQDLGSFLASLEQQVSKSVLLPQQQQQQAAALQQTVSNQLVVRRIEYLRCYQKWQLGGPEKLPFYDDTKRCVLPSNQDFESFRTAHQSYMVDKSAYIEPLLTRGRPSIFLRPRRFGKSLTLSMLKYFFYGAANLFQGMDVYDEIIRINKFVWNPSNKSSSALSSAPAPAHNFPPCPVLHLDFSVLAIKDARSFEDSLINLLNEAAVSQGAIPVDDTKDCGFFLGSILDELCSQETNEWGKVVILIDEYDAPLNYNPDIRNDLLEIYIRFFSIIKASGALIEYVYVTGISSYGVNGILSGANNFENLSFEHEFEGLCGFTTEETKEVMRKADYLLDDGDFAKFMKKYSGYSWCSSKDFGGGEDDNKLQTEETGTGTQVKNSTIVPDLTTSEEGSCGASDAASKVTKGGGNGIAVKYFNPFVISRSSIYRSMDKSYWVATSSQSLFNAFPSLLSASLPTSVSRESLRKPHSPDHSVSHQDPATSARTLLELGYATITACDVATGLVTVDYPNGEIREYMKDDFIAYCFPGFLIREGISTPLADAEHALRENLDLAPLLTLINRNDESIPSQADPGWYKDADSWRTYLYRLLMLLQFNCAPGMMCSLGRSNIEIYNPKLKTLTVIGMRMQHKEAKGARKADSKQLLREKYEGIANGALNRLARNGYGNRVFASDPLQSIEKVIFIAIVASFDEKRLVFFAEEHHSADRSRGPDGFTRSVEL